MRGMVVIESEKFGKSMELVECLEKKLRELAEELASAKMEESHRNKYYDDYEDYDVYHRMPMKGGRYNY